MPKLSRSQIGLSCIYSINNTIATEKEIKIACAEAKRLGAALVCVNGSYVPVAVKELANAALPLSATVDFPFGGASIEAKCNEIVAATNAGAQEIAMVLQMGKIKGGQFDYTKMEIEKALSMCKDTSLTVMMEASYLDDEEKLRVCEIVKSCGATHIQSNTGFGPGGATVSDIALMRQCAGNKLGVTAAGGIRTAMDMAAMLEAGASRVSTAFLVQIVKEIETSSVL